MPVRFIPLRRAWFTSKGGLAMRWYRLGVVLTLLGTALTSGCCGWHRCCHRHPIREALHRPCGPGCCERSYYQPACEGCAMGAPMPMPAPVRVGPPPMTPVPGPMSQAPQMGGSTTYLAPQPR
jgi:hypothetical protein